MFDAFRSMLKLYPQMVFLEPWLTVVVPQLLLLYPHLLINTQGQNVIKCSCKTVIKRWKRSMACKKANICVKISGYPSLGQDCTIKKLSSGQKHRPLTAKTNICLFSNPKKTNAVEV
jgi:hypothetical protein